MIIRSNKEFRKRHGLLSPKIQTQFDSRLRLFIADSRNPQLKLHPLKGKLSGYHSINISGDLRAIFKKDGDTITFVLIGRHSQLY